MFISQHSHRKRKGELWEQYFPPILGSYSFYFNDQSDKDIVIQIKNVKYDFDLT